MVFGPRLLSMSKAGGKGWEESEVRNGEVRDGVSESRGLHKTSRIPSGRTSPVQPVLKLQPVWFTAGTNCPNCRSAVPAPIPAGGDERRNCTSCRRLQMCWEGNQHEGAWQLFFEASSLRRYRHDVLRVHLPVVNQMTVKSFDRQCVYVGFVLAVSFGNVWGCIW